MKPLQQILAATLASVTIAAPSAARDRELTDECAQRTEKAASTMESILIAASNKGSKISEAEINTVERLAVQISLCINRLTNDGSPTPGQERRLREALEFYVKTAQVFGVWVARDKDR
jgi:hypothetical protein